MNADRGRGGKIIAGTEKVSLSLRDLFHIIYRVVLLG
jgi:hypothetical protein